MRNTLRAIAAILCLQPALAAAQSAPATMGYHTVYGRLGATPGDSGPGQAIPFTTLLSQLAAPLQVVNGGTGLTAASATSLPLWSTGATGGPLAYRAIVGTDLPNPSTTTLGAIFSLPRVSGQVLGGIDNAGNPQVATSGTFPVTSVNALSVGRQGTVSPAFNVDTSNANGITGINVIAQATGNGVNVTAIGETNVPLIINAAGNGTVSLNTAGTGSVNSYRNLFVLHDSNPTLTLGLSGGTLAHLSTPGTSGMAITTGGGDQVNILNTASATRQITMTGSNGGNPTIGTSAGNLAITPAVALNGGLTAPLAKAQGGTGNTAESWQYIETLTASASATLTTSAFTSAFDDYAFVFSNIVPVTDSVNFNATVESGGTFQATTYLNGAGGLTTSIDLETASTLSNIAGKGFNGTTFLNNVNSTTVNKNMSGRTIQTISGGAAILSVNVAGYWNGGQGAVTRLRFQMSSGNISAGTIKVYGIRNN